MHADYLNNLAFIVDDPLPILCNATIPYPSDCCDQPHCAK